MNFIVRGISPVPFRALFALSDAELAAQGIQRCFAEDDGYPGRVSLAHANIGEEVLLLSYEHQSASSPYRANGPIFVRKTAATRAILTDAIPEPFRTRLLSVRAYNQQDCIVDAEVEDGARVETLITRMFGNPDVAHLHVHYARRGCYAGRIDRA